jgi:hypothetical protein
MSNVVSFGRAGRPDPAASLRDGINELFEILCRLTFADDADCAVFTDPDYAGTGINALGALIRQVEAGRQRQGYAAMAAGAYLASQRLYKVAFWLEDAERWKTDKDPERAARLADENFIVYAEQALMKNARMNPDCTQYIYRAIAASQSLVQKARIYQATLGLPHPATPPEIRPPQP